MNDKIHGAGKISQEAFERAVTAENAAGACALHRLVPAVFVGPLDRVLRASHAHLPRGTELDYTMEHDPSIDGRVDLLLLCPSPAGMLMDANMTGMTMLFWLN